MGLFLALPLAPENSFCKVCCCDAQKSITNANSCLAECLVCLRLHQKFSLMSGVFLQMARRSAEKSRASRLCLMASMWPSATCAAAAEACRWTWRANRC